MYQKAETLLVDKGPYSQRYDFSSRHVWMWELNYKESWEPKNWCFWTVVLEKTHESPLNCKKIKPVNSKGNQSLNIHWKDWCWNWSFNTLATYDGKSHPIRKDPDIWKDWGQEKGVTEDEMVGWHHWFIKYEFEQTSGDWEGQGNLVCCSPWGSQSQTWLRDWITTINPIDNIYTYTPDILLFLFCPIT